LRNYFAIDRARGGVWFFGEHVDEYKDCTVAGKGGAWLSGIGGRCSRLMMPDERAAGDSCYQEIAPDIDMDRDETIGTVEELSLPGGLDGNCLHISTPLDSNWNST
jgi:hypothetical protein